MASRISPYVDNTGLVFAYDLANIKRSYLGEPTTNLIDSVNFTTDYSTSWNAQENIIQTKNQINPLGDIDVTAIKIESNSNSDNYFGVRGIKFASSGTNHTFSFWAKGNKAYNNFPINFGAYQIQVTVNITTEWKYFTVQTGAGTTFTDHTLHFGGWGTWTDNTFDLFLWRPQLELKSHATPYVNGTRSVTQGLKDLTGRSTIDLTNVSFDSNAQMTFDGTDDYAALSGFVQPSNPNNFSVEAVVKLSSHNTGTNIGSVIVNNYSSLRGWIFFLNGPSSFLGLRHHNESNPGGYNVVYGTGINLNQWYHIAATDDGTTVRLYINGVQVTSGSSGPSINFAGQPIIGQFGGGNAVTNGSIPYVRIFDRALPASEIQQNFNAIKGRYGL